MGEAKRKAKLNGGATNSSRHDHFGDFVHAVHNYGAALVLQSAYGQDASELITPEEAAAIDFSAQAYDFGRAWQDCGLDLRETVFQRACTLLMENSFHLPHEKCFFLYSSTGDPNKRNLVVEASESENGILFRFWMRSPGGRWLFRKICAALEFSEGELNLYTNGDDSPQLIAVCESLATIVLTSIVLITTRPEDQIIETDELTPRATTECANRQGIAYPTRLIRVRASAAQRFKTVTVRPVSPFTAKETVGRCPHNRRGHERVYKKTGKRIWINETKIKGGNPVPRPAVVQVLH
ncbi:protein of unknown function [Methylorubrum extorquens DM4]|uniref:Uncharacterized protein n=1 Tax=Methylorubrum extorquens (strain DSM 6343 / CIP 106787 / DM4) TaxID=661410 RepID=C7CL56_METED|nr:hypothetical protein [Methylorubrum extorquens]CAX24205.1 protein of unknown function [Methylorubrum extorquens DM4]